MFKERRLHFRRPLRSTGWVADPLGNLWQPINLLDISKGGVSFMSKEKMVVDSLRVFRFQLPDSLELVNFSGRVVDCGAHPTAGGFRVSVELTKIDAGELAIVAWLADHAKK